MTADPVATADQVSAQLEAMAQPIANFYGKLVERGLPPEDAFTLVRDWCDYVWSDDEDE